MPPPANAPTEFDLFISYAHRDGIDDIVPALHEQLESDFQRLLHRPVEIFLDRSDIRDFDDWKVRCHRALRASRFFIVLLSPAYLVRDACRWEWEEWIKRELEHGQVGVGAACLWFIEIASFDAPGDAERLRQWKNELRQRFGVNFHAWREGGREALQDAAARTELQKLTDHVAQRLRLLALDRGQRGNLGWPQDRFVGREPELRLLRERLLDAAASAPVALIGIGGIGKTALALTFAFREADAFPGGRWLLRCEGRAGLDTAMRPLVQDLGIELTEREKLDDTLAARRVLDTLRPRGPALFLLDNVDTPALLAPGSLALLSGESGIRLLITTRLAPGEFAAAGASVITIDLGYLLEDHALDLIRLHQPDAAFASAADENDAREIVRALAGLTLAVETAAVYLGQNDPRVAEPRYAVRIADYLAALRRDLASGGTESAMSQLREVAATIRPTLARLDAPARTVLQLAALLPADSLPLPWLREVAGKFHPSLATDAAIAERDEWTDLIRALIGMRLLHSTSEPQVLAIHRLLQRVLDTELRDGRDGVEEVMQIQIEIRADRVAQSQASPAPWELDALVVTLPHVLAKHPSRGLATAAGEVSERVKTYRSLPAAVSLMAHCHAILERLAANDPHNAEGQRDLAASLEKLGDLAVAQGDLSGALRNFTDAKAIAERLAASDPTNAEGQRDYSVSLNRLGDLAVPEGDLAAAFRSFSASKDIFQRLVASDPANAAWQRDLIVSCERLGNVARAQGDLTGATAQFERSRQEWAKLIQEDPENMGLQRGITVALDRLGDLAVAQGDLAGALHYFSEAKAIAESLAASDPANTAWQRDLAGSVGKLGRLAVAQGDLAGALRSYTESKCIRERLAASDPANAAWQRDLSVSLERLGDLAEAQGDLAGALHLHTERIAIAERLAASDPANAAWQSDLSVSLAKLGGLAEAQGDLAGALRYFSEAKAIAERLAASDPANAAWQGNLVASYQRSAIVSAKMGQPSEAAGYFTQSHLTLRRMRESNMHLDPALAGVLAQLERAALSNYANLIAAEASSSGTASRRPAPRIIIPDPKVQPRRDVSIEEIRESARVNFGKGYWEAAASDFQKLLAQGEPLADIAPKIVTCLLNAHEDLLPHDAATIEDLLRRLESAGHPAPAAELRRQLEAKLPKPKKPWWKFW